MTRTTPELPPLLTTTPHERSDEDGMAPPSIFSKTLSLDIFNVHQLLDDEFLLTSRRSSDFFMQNIYNRMRNKISHGAYIEVSVKHTSQKREGLEHKHPCLTRYSNPDPTAKFLRFDFNLHGILISPCVASECEETM
ncbi:hypothetical protein TNCV_4428831 [Trichonephila clavipes]|nr:hypothetical protein TNCV_4428831 [Trichonephila clavipes]